MFHSLLICPECVDEFFIRAEVGLEFAHVGFNVGDVLFYAVGSFSLFHFRIQNMSLSQSKELRLPNRNIQTISEVLEHCDNLLILNLAFNKIHNLYDLAYSDYPLRYLVLSCNKLVSIEGI